MKKILYLLTLLFCLSIPNSMAFAETAPVQSWVAVYDNGVVMKMIVDSFGNIYTTGYSNSDYATIKYNKGGEQQWVRKYDNGNVDVALDITTDIFGDIYVTGYSYNNNIYGNDFLTIKYDTNGNQLWVARGTDGEFASTISTDPQGNVYISGRGLNKSNNGYDILTVKYDTNGNQLWVARYDNGIHDSPKKIILDYSGNVYVAGESQNKTATSMQDYVVVKYDTNGNQLWVARYDNGSYDELTDVTIDVLRNVYVTGVSHSRFPNADYATVKYDTNGNQLWVARYDNGGDVATSIATDTSGYVYVTGSSGHYFVTIKYDSDGNKMWTSQYNNEAGIIYPRSLLINSTGNVYVVGDNGLNTVIVKYDSGGNQLWSILYSRGRSYVMSTVLDNLDNLYLAGYGYSILKYTPVDISFLSALKSPIGAWNLRKVPGIQNKPSDDIIKTAPNDWVLKVTNTTDANGANVDLDGYRWYQVEDVTDGVVGWTAAKDLIAGTEYLSFDASAQVSLGAKASTTLYTTKETRIPIVLQAVDTYHTQPNTLNSLYGGGGGYDGLNNFQRFIQGASFPKELVLAIAAHESAGTLDNEICASARDGGIGIMQLTSTGFKGLGSALKNYLKVDDCKTSFPTSKYYSNALQGIYANIKDGFRTLQEKYRKKCPDAQLTVGTLTYTCQDIERVLATWGYNGKVLTGNYLRQISDSLRNMATVFPGVTYANNDQFIEKLKIANANRIEFKKFSPVEIEVVDSQGRVTGFDGTPVIREEIPFSRYDREADGGVVFFPQNPYTYRVIGTGTGTYGFRVEFTKDDILRTFYATNIPIVPGEIHEYFIDWDALDRGERGTTVRIDTNGDGVIDRIVKSDGTLTEIVPPMVTVVSPAGEYLLNATTTIQFTATDASGIATITANLNGVSVSGGQLVILTNPGVNILEVMAMDNEGNEATATSTFSVLYNMDGFLLPVTSDGSKVYNQGRTLPVKFELRDVSGNAVSSAIARLYVAEVNNGAVGDDIIPVSSSTANTGNYFRYDTGSQMYIFNLSTATMSLGTWQLKAVLDSGQEIKANVQIKIK